MSPFPENFKNLHEGLELLRIKSLEAIESDEDLSRHVTVVEKAMDVLNVFSMNPPKEEDENAKAVRLLGMRLFNGCTSSLELTMSGYYQIAAMIMRDLLETAFLLNYFEHNYNTIEEWRTAKEAVRKKKFSPVKIRNALDEKDGFTEKKRAESYSLLCEMASHPTYKGFRMLAPKGENHHCGPFFDSTILKPLLEELVKLAIQAGQNYGKFFQERTRHTMSIQISFMEESNNWMARFYGRPLVEGKKIDELKDLLAQLD